MEKYMTATQEKMATWPAATKALFAPVFGDIETFYATVYLIARNEHVTEQEKPDRYEDRLQVIREIRHRVERMVTGFGLPGEEVVADIASDYFEDYVNYREPDFHMDNDTFIGLIRRIAQA